MKFQLRRTAMIFEQTKTKKKAGPVIFVAISIVLLSACNTKHDSAFHQAEWLLGVWENQSSNGSTYEAWSKASDNEYAGMSFAMRESDTLVFERIRLVHELGALHYIPTVADQNAGAAIRFTAKTITATQLIFENSQHDFPQIISYTKIATDSLVAQISGMQNGEPRTQTFPMKRLH